MSNHNALIGQRATIVRPRAAQRGGWPVPALCVLFILSWAIEPDMFGDGAGAVPALRWAIIVLMCLVTPFISTHAVRRGWSIAWFVGMLGLTMVLNGALDVSFPIFARILSAGILAIFAATLPISQRAKLAQILLWAIAAVVAGSVLLIFVAPERAFRVIGIERERLYGLTPHPAVIGYLASLVATVFCSTALFTKRKTMPRLRDGAIAVVGVIAVVLADSRTGEIALVLALVGEFGIMLLISWGAVSRSIALPWFLFVIAIVVSTTLPIAVASGVLPVLVHEDQYSGSTSSRLQIWKLGLSDFDSNMAIGNGLGTTFATDEIIADKGSGDKSLLFYYHSVLINYLAKSGIIGVLGLIAILFCAPYACLACARRVARQRSASRDDVTLLHFTVTACIVTVVFASTEAALQNLYPSFLIFFLSITLPERALPDDAKWYRRHSRST
ncbi:O-antigen ligase family protein [Bradyrhizobium sp. 166]|uniref:O-antigen ligase family protein n=1 Tax=Bradyrhizobium sp. 166 TaxID=2782638 RepID=UPI001FF96368|nr:O-antigen ligase family protein [Bradyrhizobium sp. 166]MCK1606584.1 O-antigen ligase family protein [Bradyrhizobium sp. 166]